MEEKMNVQPKGALYEETLFLKVSLEETVNTEAGSLFQTLITLT